MPPMFLRLAPTIAALTAAAASSQGPPPATLSACCHDCHAGAEPAAGLDLTRIAGLPKHDRLGLTLRIRDLVRSREMPPDDWGELDPAERADVLGWAERSLAAELGSLDLAPGSAPLRRLSRREYANAIRDLFGIGVPSDVALAPDDPALGFDNIGSGFSPLRLEKFADAAAAIAERVVDRAFPPPVSRVRGDLSLVAGRGGARGGGFKLSTNGTVRASISVPSAGRYRVGVVASGDQVSDEPVVMTVTAESTQRRFAVEWDEDRPARFSLEVHADAARLTVDVSFDNDYYEPSHPDRAERDRNLLVHEVVAEGPLAAAPAEGVAWLTALGRGPGVAAAAGVESIARELALRAWRRPATDAAIARLTALVTSSAGAAAPEFRLQLRSLVEAVLMSPRFLLRVEAPGERALDGFELAARLGFFLWGSIPDARLRSLAASGRILDRGALAAEVRRMLRHPRVDALATGFAAQWLELTEIGALAPDPARFPGFDPPLAAAMRRESELLFLAVLREGRPAAELLAADFTYLDARLATLYRLADPRGLQDGRYQRVPAPRAGGLLGHAGILALTSNPTRTSPVKRGRWILGNILDAPPPPPQPGTDSFADEAAVTRTPATMREQLARHREDAKCAVCHVRMDGLGLALERFDPIGARREVVAGAAIDASGELPGGRRIDDLDGLARELEGDPAFVRCLARKLMVFAIGRALTVDDQLAIERLVRSLPGAATTIEDLVLGIVQLDAFRRIGSDGVER